jgi:4,5-dihydroxyphthalate decarboxylase
MPANRESLPAELADTKCVYDNRKSITSRRTRRSHAAAQPPNKGNLAMKHATLDIAFWNYDRTRLLADGSVKIAGAEARFHSARIVPEIFRSMVRDRAYDAAELGMTYFLRTMDVENPPFLAIPVFLVRSFRHNAIYINKASGISRPQDLAGKRIGELALYGHDAGVMPKGILSDEYGVRPEQSRWIVGGIDFPMDPIDFVACPVPDGVEVEWASKDVDLGDMLERGEIDALISADAPRCVLEKSPRVGRLFEDYQVVERDYFRRTGIFPIMHAVVVTRELALERPNLVRAIYDGFCAAKDQMQAQYVRGMTFNNMTIMLPWLSKLIGDNRDLLGEDWWPYGVAANRAALDAVLRYHHEQGLTRRRFAIEDVFAPGLLDT